MTDISFLEETFTELSDDDIDHIYCCNPDLALCGKDVTGEPMTDHDRDNGKFCELCVSFEELDLPCNDTCINFGSK